MRDFSILDTPILPRLSTRGLRLSVAGQTLLDGVDLTVPHDGITTVMGPNGAGKSLLLRALHGLIEAEGRIDWTGPAPRQAMVFQKPVLLRRSVAGNLDFVLRDRARRDALLDRVGLLGHARRPARRLSGGEQQRLALVRALATDPDLLLLDEPTASLDPASALIIEELLREVAGTGVTILLVTHDIAQARRLADHAAVLARGRVVEQGAATRVLTAPESREARAFLAGQLVP